MKKVVLILFTLIIFFGVNIQDTNAQTCSNFEIVDAIGDPPYSYQLGVSGCEPGFSYYLIITDNANNRVTQLDLYASGNSNWSTSFPFSARPANYRVYLAAIDNIPDNPSDPTNPPPTYEEWTYIYLTGPPVYNYLEITVNERPEDADDPTPPVVVTIDNCGSDEEPGIGTAIGCVFFGNPISIATTFIVMGAAIAGGIAFIMTIYASFNIMTSSGDPTKLKSSQELLVAAIGGILVITLSTLIIRVFGVNILGLF